MEPEEIGLFLGETLAGGYRPQGYLGAGAFCGAFEATNPADGEPVAIKILEVSRLTADAVQEFKDEVEMLRRLNGSSCVVRLKDSGQHTIQLRHQATGAVFPVTTEFAVLELAAASLIELVLSGPAFSWPDRLKLFRDVVKGVHQMHLKGIVHRDLKAENVLVFDRPGSAKVADLGRAHDVRNPPRFAVDAYLMGRGDPHFAPLEFLWGQGTQRDDDHAAADLYLLGSLLFEMGTGVALTPLIVNDPLAIMQANASLSATEREAAWIKQVPWLHAASLSATDTFAQSVPRAIRDRACELLLLLTDPSPAHRIPSARGGSRSYDAWNLEWLLKKIDSMRLVVDASHRRDYLARRPRRRTSRPRAPKS